MADPSIFTKDRYIEAPFTISQEDIDSGETGCKDSEKKDLGPKQIDGKARFDLIPPQCLFELAKVYNLGCDLKYPKKSWEKGLVWGEVYGQIQRHLNSWMGGEQYDPEDDLHHLAHAVWACFTLMHFEWNSKGVDDRTLQINREYKKTFSKKDLEKCKVEVLPTEDDRKCGVCGDTEVYGRFYAEGRQIEIDLCMECAQNTIVNDFTSIHVDKKTKTRRRSED